MKLLLDIGNTRIKAAVADADGIGDSLAVMHSDGQLSEALEELASRYEPREIWVASVAGPDMQERLQVWADEHWDIEPRFVTSSAEACGVSNAYSAPANLGVDRWLAVIAAHHRGQGAACVVDAGTCLTLDVVDADGKHLGGLIAPGVSSQRSAVWGKTQVRAQTQDLTLRALADNTDDCVSFGTLQGPLGLIERVLQQLQEQCSLERFLLTGGEAEILAPYLEEFEQAPNLVLEGLGLLAGVQ